MQPPSLIDCHMHLQDPAFEADREAVLQRAQAAGVQRLVCNGTREEDWPLVAELARRHASVIPCFGLHPWYVPQRAPGWLDELNRHLDAAPAAVGEVGLDRWIEPRDEPAQEEVFRAQLAVTRQRGLPVMIHCLRAWGWLMDVLAGERPLPAGMLIHAYGGPVDLIEPLARQGAYFSFAGNVFEERRTKAREALAAVPVDRLLLETDAPDMLPPPHLRLVPPQPAGRNEPANLPAILRAAADVRGLEESRLAAILEENAGRFLGKLQRRDGA